MQCRFLAKYADICIFLAQFWQFRQKKSLGLDTVDLAAMGDLA